MVEVAVERDRLFGPFLIALIEEIVIELNACYSQGEESVFVRRKRGICQNKSI